MKKYSILTGVLFGIIIFGFVQNVPFVYAAQGDLGSIAEQFEFDESDGTTPQLIQISDTVYAVAYVGSSGDGKIATFTIAADGNIGALISGSPVTFDAGTVTEPKIFHVTESRYAVAYVESSTIKFSTFTVSDSGDISSPTNPANGVAPTVSDASAPEIIELSGDIGGTKNYALVYTADSNNAGRISTFSVTSTGTFASINAGVTFADEVFDAEIIKISDSSQKYVVAYRDTDVVATAKGQVEIVTITDAGTVTVGNITLELNQEGDGGSALLISTLSKMDIAHVSGTTYAVVWADTADAKIQTITIPDDGSSITHIAISSALDASGVPIDPVFLQTDFESSQVNFVVAYHESSGITGELRSVTISPNGATITNKDTLQFDGTSPGGQTPSLVHRTGDNYAVAYRGTGSDGFVSSFNLGAPGDTTAPTFTASRTSATSVTLTFDENVDATSTDGTGYSSSNGGTVTANSLPGGTSTMTLTITGIIDTSITPTITYSTTGDTVDTAPTPNEVANGSNAVATDNAGPTVIKVIAIGADSATVIFSEAVDADATDYDNIDVSTNGAGTDDTQADTATINADTPDTVLITWTSGSNLAVGETVSVNVNSVVASAGATTAQADDGVKTSAALVASTTLVDDDGDGTVDFPLTTDTLVTAITAPANTAPVVTTGSLANAPSVSNNGRNILTDAGANPTSTAAFPNSIITVTSGTSIIEFPASVSARFADNESQAITIAASSKDASADANFVAAHSGIDLAGATIVEFGNSGQDIFFDLPVKVTIPSIAGSELIFSVDNAGNTLEILTCGAAQANSAAAATTLGNVGTGTTVLIDGDACFFGDDIWTYHFSGFGGGNTPADTTTSTSGGGGGDDTEPSIYTAFADNEFPLIYDGVNYQPDQFDTVHTAIIGTGNEFKTTLSIYENEGAGNLQHVEIYVNHFGSQILNNLSETIVIYDEQTGLEIIDPNNLITTADIIPSVSGNKAVFDFVLVFENEIPQSDILFRLWDTNRNSLQIHLPDALIVEISEQPSGILSEPSSETTQTEDQTIVDQTIVDQTIVDQTIVDQAVANLVAANLVTQAAATESAAANAAAAAAQTAALNDPSLADIAAAAQAAADQATANLAEAELVEQTAATKATQLTEELVEQTAIIESETTPSETISETLESNPESTFGSKTWTGGQISVLEKWGGYDEESVSDIDVLAKFGIKGEIIPQYAKKLVRWILNDQLSYEEFIDVLQFYKKEGLLTNSDDAKHSDIQIDTSVKKSIDNLSDFKTNDEENKLYSKADLGSLDEQIKLVRSLANNLEIQNEIILSNAEFEASDNIRELLDQRDTEWLRNPKSITPLMDSVMNNESAMIINMLIEHNADDLAPVKSIIITNAHGANVAISEKTPDYMQSDEQWWDNTKTDGIFIMSGSGSEDHSGLYITEISMTISDDQGNFIGIIKAVVDFSKALLSD